MDNPFRKLHCRAVHGFLYLFGMAKKVSNFSVKQLSELVSGIKLYPCPSKIFKSAMPFFKEIFYGKPNAAIFNSFNFICSFVLWFNYAFNIQLMFNIQLVIQYSTFHSTFNYSFYIQFLIHLFNYLFHNFNHLFNIQL